MSAGRQRAIIWANVDPNLYRQMASLGYNGLWRHMALTWRFVFKDMWLSHTGFSISVFEPNIIKTLCPIITHCSNQHVNFLSIKSVSIPDISFHKKMSDNHRSVSGELWIRNRLVGNSLLSLLLAGRLFTETPFYRLVIYMFMEYLVI